jgi:Fe-S cluster biogenesis protein NfuA
MLRTIVNIGADMTVCRLGAPEMVMDPAMVDQIEAALDEIRPALEMDGGTVELREVTKDRIVRLAMVGACEGCPMSMLTVKMGIERLLFERVPGIIAVEVDGVASPVWD